MRKLRIVIVLILFNALLAGCGIISKDDGENKNEDMHQQTGSGLMYDGTASANTGGDAAKAQQAVTRPDKLDFEALDKLDGKKVGWGISLNSEHKVPEIPSATSGLLKKYNAYYTGDTSQKKLYLIFSAGYENGFTGSILDTLSRNNVKASFFLVGDYLKSEGALVRRMLDEGHVVGNHSMGHACLPDVGNDKLQSEIVDAEKYFNSNYGGQFKYFMPPSGEYSEKVLAAAKQLGYTTVFWSFAYVDFDIKNQKGPDYAYKMVMDHLHNGALLFLHLVSSDNAGALDRIIKDAKAQGYTFSALDF